MDGNPNYPPLDVERICRETLHIRLCPDIRSFETVDSTNRVARDLPPGEWRTGTTVITDFQAAGRGRKDRQWQAPPRSGLLLSVLFDLSVGYAATDGIMMASLATAQAIEEVAQVRSSLKWPNDVLLDGKKVCGILAEYEQGRDWKRLILGIGINVHSDPSQDGVPDAISLDRAAGARVSREDLAVALLRALDTWHTTLEQRPDAVFDAWKAGLETLGRAVTVVETDRSWDGTAEGVLRNGALQVRGRDGVLRSVYAADVSVRQQRGL